MDTPITRAEHEEFCKRMEAEHKRQNERIENLEETTRQIGELTASVHELAHDMSQMLQEQRKQGERLDEQAERMDSIEQAPAQQAKKRWDRIAEKALDTAVGAVMGAVTTGLILMATQYIV